MPLYDFWCEACSRREEDQFWATWREAKETIPCPDCGETMVRLAGRFVGWGPAVEWDDATGDVRPASGRAEVPGREIFRGTPLEEAAAAGETVNPYLPPDHPGYYKRGTGYRAYVDLGRE